MSPIVTHEDELILSRSEKTLASLLKKVAKWQRAVVGSQKKLTDNLEKLNIARQLLNRTFRDALKQMQTLVRESNSNIKEEEVNMFQDIIHKNDQHLDVTSKYLNAIKDLTIRKEDLATRIDLFANALNELGVKRAAVIKKALNIEKTKDKMIKSSKLIELENQLKDFQREYERARNTLHKEIEQYLQVQTELNEMWIKLKETINEMS